MQTSSSIAASPRPARIGLVGVGALGLTLIDRLIARTDWSLAGVADRSRPAYARFQARHHARNIPFHADAVNLLREAPDLIVIATTAPGHVPVAEALLAAGYPGRLLIEKPLADSVRVAERFAENLQATGRDSSVAVDYPRRCAPIYGRLVNELRSGMIGGIRRIRVRTPGRISMNGIHFVDLALWLSGLSPTAVRARLASLPAADHRGAVLHDPPGKVDVRCANQFEITIETTGDAAADRYVVVEGETGEYRIDASERILCSRHSEQRFAEDAYAWISATLSALLAGGGELCRAAAAAESLAVIAAAFASDEAGGRWIDLPLSPNVAARLLAIA
jgi:predicted dehydrogenase